MKLVIPWMNYIHQGWELRFELIVIDHACINIIYLLQLQPGELLMYISLDVYTWMQVRKNCGRPDFTRVGNYILATSADRRDFEKFRDSEFYNERPLIKTDFLVQFMEKKSIPIEYCNKFNIDFIVNFPSSLFDELCDWVRNHLQTRKTSDEIVDTTCKNFN